MTEIRPLRAYAEVALGRQRSPAHDVGPHMVPYLRAANVKDGTLDLTDIKEMNFTPPEQKTFSLQAGDVLVTEGSGSLGSVGASAVWSGELPGTVCFQNTLLRLRPRPLTDGRFLAWWCRHTFADGIFASISTGANIFHVSAERVRSLPVTYLTMATQRKIADFLDAETDRIDALIDKKRRMIELLEQRIRAEVEVRTSDGPTVKVGHLTSLITSGSRGWSEFVGDYGRPFVRSGNLVRSSIDLRLEELARVDPPARAAAEARRSCLVEGDVLVGITGANAGWVGIAGEEVAGGYVSQHVALLRASGVASEWLGFSMFSHRAQTQLLGSQYGGTKQQLGLSDLSELRVRVPTAEVQRSHLRTLAILRERTVHTATCLRSQILLLQEHRQALITAAVTGELDLPGVAA